MRARSGVAALGAIAVLSLAPAAGASPGEIAGPAPAQPDTPEIRFDLLLPRLETALAAARADTTFDPVALIEAEETAAVAEEFLEEGEAEMAVRLLEQAIVLLPEPVPE